nr:hypothetical protein [uncultured Methanoregula sp.]
MHRSNHGMQCLMIIFTENTANSAHLKIRLFFKNVYFASLIDLPSTPLRRNFPGVIQSVSPFQQMLQNMEQVDVLGITIKPFVSDRSEKNWDPRRHFGPLCSGNEFKLLAESFSGLV